MRFREHRGSLEDSMATVQEVSGIEDLRKICRDLLEPFGFRFADDALNVSWYDYDPRIDWDTQIVSIKGYGVIGYTDAPMVNN